MGRLDDADRLPCHSVAMQRKGPAVPLHFTGKTHQSFDSGTLIEATDATTGTRVVVRATDEAMQDCGMAAIQSAASQKYDRRQLEGDGRVLVRTEDCG